jgi:threonine/homoserine/homoserine lactone efflux protein
MGVGSQVHDLALFSLTVLVLNATPGVDMLLAVSQTLRGGLRAGIATVLGISAGCVVHTLLAALGLASLLALTPWAFQLVAWAGALYLAWQGVAMLKAAWRPHASTTTTGTAADGSSIDLQAAFRQGLWTNVLNPKVALFVLAFVPQFIHPQATHKTLAFLALGAGLVLQGTLFMLALVAVLAHLHGRPGLHGLSPRGLQAVSGSLFVVLAARILWSYT